MWRLRAVLSPTIPASDDISDSELPHRLIAGDFSHQNFEEVAESKPKINNKPYSLFPRIETSIFIVIGLI